MLKKVSVVVPMYNMEKYIEKCLVSILNQSYDNLEIIIVNDGSTDESVNLLQSFIEKDRRIRLLHKMNGGLNSAVSFGIQHATGVYVVFVDSDDYIGKDYIENFINQIEDNDCISMGFYYSNLDQKIEYRLEKDQVFVGDDLKILNSNFLYDSNLNLSNKIFVSRWNKMYKLECVKKFIQDYQKFKYISFGEDTLFISFLLQNIDSIKTVQKCNSYYYNIANQNSMTSVVKNIEKIDEEFASILKLQNDLKALGRVDNISNLLIYYLGISYLSKYKQRGKRDYKSFLKVLCNNLKFNSSLKQISTSGLSIKGKMKVFLLKHKLISLYCFFS